MSKDVKEVSQSNFLDMVPQNPSNAVRQPKKLHPRWLDDEEEFMQIVTDPKKRELALSSDALHDKAQYRKALRKAWGLPEKTPPWKEVQAAFMALTPQDKEDLQALGYRPEYVRNPHSMTVERMLHDLQVSRRPEGL